MKQGKIMLFFGISLPICVLMRALQLFFTVDTQTGFFKPEYITVGIYLLFVILAFCVCLAVICFSSHRAPEHPPVKNPLLSLVAVFLGLSVLIEIYADSSSVNLLWQSSLISVTGILAAFYFFAFGAERFLPFKLPPLFSVAPTLYLIARIIYAFTSVSSLALISDNILLLAAYCVSLLFFLSFGRVYNGIEAESGFRRLLATGLVATLLCLTSAIPHFVINFVTNGAYLHTSGITNLGLLVLGLFIGVFTLSHFAKENCEPIRETVLPIENTEFSLEEEE